MNKPTWALATYTVDGDEAERLGVLVDGKVVEPPPELEQFAGLMPLLQHWDDVSAELTGWSPSEAAVIAGANLLTPVKYPRKLLGACANYRKHLDQFGSAALPGTWDGFFHLTPPTSTIIGPDASIQIDPDPADEIDWEAELAVVIGRGGSNISVQDAPQHVAGYMIANDVSARGGFRRSEEGPPSLQFDWVRSKGRDTFKPLGPAMTPAHLIEDPHALQVRLWVNDEQKQDFSTSGMTLNCWELIAAASRTIRLEPGDVIMTGSGPGNAWHKQSFLTPGDRIRMEIDFLGSMENTVVSLGAPPQ